MGEPEQLIAEPDEVEGEVVEGLHPPTLEQHTPSFITSLVNPVYLLVTTYGWYTIGFLLLGYVLWLRFEPKIKEWLRKREEEKEMAEYHKNPDTMLAKQRAIDEARRRMQEQYNLAAAISLEKKKEMEEKKKDDKIKEWERMQPSGGQRLGSADSSGSSSSSSSNATATPSTSKGKTATKSKLRPEYNPMTGDTGASSCRWRPSAQRPSGGG